MTSTQQAPFAGANALIFGGAKGIGRCVALEWARRGARLAVADIDEDAAKATAAEIEAAGGKAVGIGANIMSEESIAAAIGAAEAALGEIDILMNNVGGILNGHPEDVPMREWQRIMELNYLGSARATTQMLPKFLACGKGYIVNTASFAGLYPYAASRVPYAASKAAVIAMTESLAIYCEPLGVRVSCLIPGPVATGVMDTMTSWTENCPMRGPGKETTLMLPEAVAMVLADGMRDGRILIPSDDVAFDVVKRWAQSPDQFIRDKIAEFESGDRGNPIVPEAILAAMGAKK
ncbi:SDR family NAD(P)-dependent oxidoreductase [Novosphingobium sp. JCM 18896]|uniref:SDR family NAD(P)-dependent oxidoreductase n=1 Tax=Novosphingobium sp. JCM 18896 TaxID=2989731 RepID=UPI0022239537|nr:SDR family oxidoreductase [Novosphingobium sp. JCM 18896]MCW1430355.1 SDR family oxidoreductase [Novosphingobium sp. JCM 18896]